MKPFSLVLLLAAIVFGLVAHAAEQQLYTCGMHPQIIKTEPGNCPICGMKLTPIRANAPKPGTSGPRTIKFYKSTMLPGEVSPRPGRDSMGMDMVPVYDGEDASSSAIQIDAATVQRMNLKTGVVTRGPVDRQIRTVGTVAYDETGLRDITTKYEGWIEKLFVNATWAQVKAGEPLFEIYSPDLYNAQLNFLVARRSEGDAGGPLTRAATARLQLFDMPESFIRELAQRGEAQRTTTFRAPTDGVVIEKMAIVGQMMKPGERIYRIADLSRVWVLAQISEKDLAFLRAGQTAVVRASYGAVREIQGQVEQVLPQVEEQTRTATARIVLPNPAATLRPGMFVDVSFSARLTDAAVLVPEIAVLRSGERDTVFLARDGGTFEAREVKLGHRSADGRYEVLSGLHEGDRVVTSGQFMLDSESQLREAIQKMTKSAGAEKAGRVVPDAPSGSASENPERRVEDNAPYLRSLAFASADVAAALAADDLAGYEKQRPAIAAALKNYFAADLHAEHGPLAAFKEGLPPAPDLAAARRDFEPFSTAIADLARAAHLQHTAGLHVFECPMAPATGKARWLQRTSGTKNPFFGKEMPACGDEIEAAASPGAGVDAPKLRPVSATMKLPPGHPPIAQMTLTDFMRSQMGTGPALVNNDAQSGGDACGSCGMSAAAMAAGEPCEHSSK